MPSNPCRDFFAINAITGDVAKALQKQPSPIAWERMSASDHSPGPVSDGEVVYRQILHPIHIDIQTRKLKPAAFADAADKGMSVERVAHKSLDDIRQSGRDRAAAQRKDPKYADRRLFAVAELHSIDIRSIVVDGGKRALAVYDTAECNNAAHADVYQVIPGRQSFRSARSQLFDAVRSLIEE
jgi:hypothetical protein